MLNISKLFAKKSARLDDLAKQLRCSIASGKFYRLAPRARSHFVFKIHRLTKRVKQIRWQMKLVAFGGSVAALSNTHEALAQNSLGPFVQQNRLDNPLRYPIWGNQLKPTAVDLDNDGDYDMVAGNSDYLIHLKNTGTASAPIFPGYSYLSDSYGYMDSGFPEYKPAFADVDGDGDLDMAVATYNSGIVYYRNDEGQFTLLTGSSSPFNTIVISTFPSISFFDYDGDLDMDFLVSDSFSGGGRFQYFRNDGPSTFTPTVIPLPDISGSDFRRPVPILSDIDQDGNPDLTIGTIEGVLRFFEDTGTGWVEDPNEWDPETKTGNPFEGIDLGSASSPEFVDIDNDGDLDLIAGYSGSYLSEPLAYFINEGNANFERQLNFDNPFGGVRVGGEGVPYFVDIDGDGDLDAVLGGKYDSSLSLYKNNNSIFSSAADEENPFKDLEIAPFDGAKPALVDIDGDGDLDLFTGSHYGSIIFFLNDEGILVEQPDDISNPLYGISTDDNTAIDLVDIDNDGDFDIFSGNDQGNISFFENIGTKQSPKFQIPTDPATNPLDKSHIPQFLTNHFDNAFTQPRFTDIDHDGDFDLLLGAYYNYGGITENGIFLFKNIGTPEAAEFVMEPGFLISDTYDQSNPGLIDMDGDGDLDLFIGNEYGEFEYYVNENPAPETTVTSTILDYEFGTGSVILDANLALTDSDNDFIVKATVTIQSYQQGDEFLEFTTQSPITGTFDDVNGVLTLQGKASLALYQSVLRTVTYSYTGNDPGGRKVSSGKVKSISRTVAFNVYDQDLTTPTSSSRTINVASPPTANQPPVITTSQLTTVINGMATLDLLTIASDPDNNLDPDSFVITQQPISGAPASISNSILTVDYSNSTFAGLDNLKIIVSDQLGSQSPETTISIQVEGNIVIYNGVSPNGDGMNDYFNLQNIQLLQPENKVSIFNRWGDKVFEIDNYDNQNRRFEGRSDNGKDLPSGVYFYKIKFPNDSPELKGYITIKR